MFCYLKTYVAIRMDEKVCRNRHGKTGKLGRVNRIVGQVGLTHIFQTNFFFFFNYKNKSITTYLEKMNKIN